MICKCDVVEWRRGGSAGRHVPARHPRSLLPTQCSLDDDVTRSRDDPVVVQRAEPSRRQYSTVERVLVPGIRVLTTRLVRHSVK